MNCWAASNLSVPVSPSSAGLRRWYVMRVLLTPVLAQYIESGVK